MTDAKKIIVSFGFVILLQSIGFSQVNFPLNLKLADSLEQILPLITEKEKVDVMNEISYALIRHYSNRSDSVAHQSMELASALNYKKGLAKALFCKGANDYINGNFIEGLDLLHKAADLFKELNDTSMIIDTYYQIAGVTYFSFTDLEEGIRLVDKCLQYSIEAKDKLREAQMYATLQYLYAIMGNGDKALFYIGLYDSIVTSILTPRIEQAMVIAARGRNFTLKGEFKKAVPLYRTAFKMVNPEDIEERSYLSQLCSFIGDAFLNLGNPDSAYLYYQKGMLLAQKHQHYYGSIVNALGLSRLFFVKQEFERSAEFCDSVLFFGERIDLKGSFYGIRKYEKFLGMSGELYIPMNKEFKRFIAWRMMSGAYQILIKVKEQQLKYKEVYLISKPFNNIQDSIANFQKRKEILELQYKYQAQQKDDQITLLSQENQIKSFKIVRNRFILFAIITISFLLILVLVLFLRQNNIKSERRVAEFKQRLLRSQMNPHFIFNSLTSIQNFILQHDDIKASVYLSRFSDLVRNILHNSQVELITLEEELNTIENYLELQKIRFPQKFEYNIVVDKNLDIEVINIPPMLIQPFIENAIEHGFKDINYPGKIKIGFVSKSEWLIVQISDNGIGRKKSQEIKTPQEKEHQSMATIITTERIRTINKKIKNKIHFKVIDLKDRAGIEKGTKVDFEIPLTL